MEHSAYMRKLDSIASLITDPLAAIAMAMAMYLHGDKTRSNIAHGLYLVVQVAYSDKWVKSKFEVWRPPRLFSR